MNTKLKKGKKYFVIIPGNSEEIVKPVLANLIKCTDISVIGYAWFTSQSCFQFIEAEE